MPSLSLLYLFDLAQHQTVLLLLFKVLFFVDSALVFAPWPGSPFFSIQPISFSKSWRTELSFYQGFFELLIWVWF